jgi:hypothetical protein
MARALAGLNYFQSITPQLSAGCEMFYLSQQLKSGVGLAARHTGEKHIATMQLATTGILQAAYAHKVTEKVSLFKRRRDDVHATKGKKVGSYERLLPRDQNRKPRGCSQRRD